MRIITCFFLFLTLAVSFGIWTTTSNTHLLDSRIEKAAEEITAMNQESMGLDKYKDEQAIMLDKFYPEVFNDINEISSYYHADSEVKIIAAKDLVNTREFFKPSQYKGINYVDILCQVDLKDQPDTYLFVAFYKMAQSMPIEILGLNLEKNILSVTMRLYGS
jgi:hypothetical protein